MSDAKLVYSSDGSHKNQNKKTETAVRPQDYELKIRRETQSRGGKAVTVIYDLPKNEAYCKDLARQLKKACGTGGTYKADRIEIQGEKLEKVGEKLSALGFRWKKTGG